MLGRNELKKKIQEKVITDCSLAVTKVSNPLAFLLKFCFCLVGKGCWYFQLFMLGLSVHW